MGYISILKSSALRMISVRAIASSPSRLSRSAADHDPLSLVPGLGIEDTARDVGKFLREVLDSAVDDGRSLGIVANQDRVESFLADVL